MKQVRTALLGLALVFALVTWAYGQKEETLKGNITCAKCELKLEAKCATVIEADKKVYYFDDAAGKKYHKEICQAGKKGTVTGTVEKKGDKLTIKVKECKFD